MSEFYGPVADQAEREMEPVDALMQEMGIQEAAGNLIVAHGGVYTVRQAFIDCEDFAEYMKGLHSTMKENGVETEMAKTILIGSISKMAANIPPEADAAAKKKLNPPPSGR